VDNNGEEDTPQESSYFQDTKILLDNRDSKRHPRLGYMSQEGSLPAQKNQEDIESRKDRCNRQYY
jgi:hypothetical protein